MAVLYQVLCTGFICMLSASMGLMFAWPSSTLRLFESKNTTLHRPMTESELAVFGSLSSVGALVGTPLLGYCLDKVGRKNSSIVSSALGVISWGLMAASSRVELVLFAMFLAGISGSAFLIIPVYVGEICQDSIRGGMTTVTMVFYGVGALISYLLGGLLSYTSMIYFCMSISAAVTVSLVLMKESPTYLMTNGLEEEAARAIAFYRSLKTDSKEVLEELNVIRRCLNPVFDEMTPEEEKLNDLEQKPKCKEKLSLVQFLRKSRSTRRGLYLNLILITASVFQGLLVLQVYAVPLFVESVPSMSPTLGAVLLASVIIVASLVAAYLTERAGRRPLMIYGSFATGVSSLLLGLQLHLKWGPSWLIAFNIYVYTTLYCFGAGTVPYVLIAELFLPEVKGFATMLVVECSWICSYIILFMFNPLLKAIGLGPVFYIFAAVCALTGVYSIFMLPETKGLAIDEIQDKLCNRRRKNVYWASSIGLDKCDTYVL